jgi:hypothetical protein
MEQRYMTYAETRARLRERRPIQRVPVAQQGQNAVQTGRRTRRSALRFLRRAAEDQQPVIGEPQQLAGRRPTPIPPTPENSEQPQETRTRHRQVRFRNAGDSDLMELEDGTVTPQNELMDEEKRLYETVRGEYEALCVAVGDKVAQMRSLADELDDLQQQSSSSTLLTSTQKRRAQFTAHRSATTTDFTSMSQQTLWQSRVESLDVSFVRKKFTLFL